MVKRGRATWVVAVAAFIGCIAMAPSAQAHVFTASSYPASISGVQSGQHALTIQGQKFACNSISFSSTLTQESSALEIAPSYSGCGNAFYPMTITMNGCKYVVSASSGSGDAYSGGLQISCPEGKAITITVTNYCVIHVPAQTPTTNSVSYQLQTGSPNKVLLSLGVAGIHSRISSAGFPCPLSANETDTTFSYYGSTEMGASGGAGFDIARRDKYTASSYPASLTGSQTTQHVLEVQGKTLKCGTASFSAELTAAASSLSASGTYGECTAFGFSGASVNMNGCKFAYGEPSFVKEDEFKASASIACPAGKEIVVKGGTCEALIASQGSLNSVVLTDMTGAPNTLTAKTEISGLIVNAKSGVGCPLEEKAVSNATYAGVTEFKGSGGVGVDVGS